MDEKSSGTPEEAIPKETDYQRQRRVVINATDQALDHFDSGKIGTYDNITDIKEGDVVADFSGIFHKNIALKVKEINFHDGLVLVDGGSHGSKWLDWTALRNIHEITEWIHTDPEVEEEIEFNLDKIDDSILGSEFVGDKSEESKE